MIERKCLSCGTWNKDEDHCQHCGLPVSPKEIVKAETNKKREEEANRPPDKFDVFAARMKNHKYLFMRILYKIGYSIAMVFAAIGGFVAWMVAMANG